MVCPASTLSPEATATVTTPANGAATWSGLERSAFSAAGTSLATLAIAHQDRPQLAVEDAHHGAHAAFVGFGDRLQPDQQLDAALELDAVLVAAPQPVEELVGRQARGVTVEIPVRVEFLCGTGEQQAVQFRLTLGTRQRERRFVVGCELLGRLGRWPAGQRLGAQRLRPAAGRVAQFAAQEFDDGVRNVESRWIGGELVGGHACADQRQVRGRRPPSTTGSPSPTVRGCGRRRRSSPRSVRTGPPARARWPAGAGCSAGRLGISW